MAIGVICIIVVACAMEFYKKMLRGITTDEGRKTKAGKWEIITVALIISAFFSLIFYKVEELSNPWAYPLILAAIYFLQYLVDMKAVKQFINLVGKNVANKG